MKIGKTYWVMGQARGRDKQRERIKKEREREVVLVERGNGVGRNDHWLNQQLNIFRERHK